MKWLLFAFLFLVFPLSVHAVINNSLIELRAGCFDAYGNICSGVGQITVIDPLNVTYENNTACDNVALGVYDCTFFVNNTGLWFAYVNFSGYNVTREYNINVEVDTMAGLWLIPVILGLILIMIAFYFVALKLSGDHIILAVFFFVLGNTALMGNFYVMSVVSENSLVTTVTNWGFYASIVMSVAVVAYFLIYTLSDGFKKISEQLRGMR